MILIFDWGRKCRFQFAEVKIYFVQQSEKFRHVPNYYIAKNNRLLGPVDKFNDKLSVIEADELL